MKAKQSVKFNIQTPHCKSSKNDFNLNSNNPIKLSNKNESSGVKKDFYEVENRLIGLISTGLAKSSKNINLYLNINNTSQIQINSNAKKSSMKLIKKKIEEKKKEESNSHSKSNSNNKIDSILKTSNQLIIKEKDEILEEMRRTTKQKTIIPKAKINFKLELAKSLDPRTIHTFINVYDSVDEEEEDKVLDLRNLNDINDTLYIHPDSYVKYVFKKINSLLNGVSSIYYPFLLAFLMTYTYSFFLIDCIFWTFNGINLLITLKSAFYQDEDDKLVVNKIKSMEYILFRKFIHLLEFCYFTYIIIYFFLDSSSIIEANHMNISITIFYYIKLYRNFKFIKFFSISNLLKDENKKHLINEFDGIKKKRKIKLDLMKYTLFKFLYILILLLVIIHAVACLWIFVGKHQNDMNNWISYYKFEDSRNFDIYIASFYYCTTTIFTVGFGDIVPHTLTEILFILLMLNFGIFIYSLIISTMSDIFKTSNEKHKIFDNKKGIFIDILKEFKVKNDLKNKINKYLEYDFKNYNNHFTSFFDQFSPNIKNELYLKVYEKKLLNLKFFKGQSFEFVSFVVPFLKSNLYEKGDELYSIGQIMKDVYFVQNGKINLSL